jgi:hypothetical protein
MDQNVKDISAVHSFFGKINVFSIVDPGQACTILVDPQVVIPLLQPVKSSTYEPSIGI